MTKKYKSASLGEANSPARLFALDIYSYIKSGGSLDNLSAYNVYGTINGGPNFTPINYTSDIEEKLEAMPLIRSALDNIKRHSIEDNINAIKSIVATIDEHKKELIIECLNLPDNPLKYTNENMYDFLLMYISIEIDKYKDIEGPDYDAEEIYRRVLNETKDKLDKAYKK